jgi:FKBP-type peptidyl-prolyl cis-trans isomerase
MIVSESKEGPGILIRTLTEGDTEQVPKIGDNCLVHYECCLENGTTVDSTRERNQPLQFTVGSKHVIKGVEVAVQKMSMGQHAEITVPHLYAYGQLGHAPLIPPRSTLIFRLELMEIEKKGGRLHWR